VLTWHALDGADDYIITANELLNFLIYISRRSHKRLRKSFHWLIATLKVEYMKIKYYPDADALDIRISDEKPDYGEEAGEEMILHYTKDRKLVKIEILDASKTVIDFLEPILSQKPLAKKEKNVF
jgi:uncharacterized protein YuzE